MKKLAIYFIELYQKTISPDHGTMKKCFPTGCCRFTPSCSEYTKRAILQYGLLYGGLKGVWRILRCNPWTRGGVDNP